MPEGTVKVDFVTLILQSYFDILLRYVLSVSFCGAAVLKVMDQKTPVKRRWRYKVRISMVYINNNNFIDFIFDMKISVPKLSI